MFWEITKFKKGNKYAYITYNMIKKCWLIKGIEDLRWSKFKYRVQALNELRIRGYIQCEKVSYVGEK